MDHTARLDKINNQKVVEGKTEKRDEKEQPMTATLGKGQDKEQKETERVTRN